MRNGFLLLLLILPINLVQADVTLPDDYVEEVITYGLLVYPSKTRAQKMLEKAQKHFNKSPRKSEKYIRNILEDNKLYYFENYQVAKLYDILLDSLYAQKKYGDFERALVKLMRTKQFKQYYHRYYDDDVDRLFYLKLAPEKFNQRSFDRKYLPLIRSMDPDAQNHLTELFFINKQFDHTNLMLEISGFRKSFESDKPEPSRKFFGMLLYILKQTGKVDEFEQYSKKLIKKDPGIKIDKLFEFLGKSIEDKKISQHPYFYNFMAVKKIRPLYPQQAAEKKITGYVIVQHSVNEMGDVFDMKVIESKPNGLFDESALDAVKQFKYVPSVDENGEATNTHNIKNKIIFRLASPSN